VAYFRDTGVEFLPKKDVTMEIVRRPAERLASMYETAAGSSGSYGMTSDGPCAVDIGACQASSVHCEKQLRATDYLQRKHWL